MTEAWTVSVFVEVRDESALWEAAVGQRIDDYGGNDAPDLEDLGTADAPNVANCLRTLVDPGDLPGCKILDSEAST